jgi:hypothetical protein
MKAKYESERTAALIEEALAILECLENAPESPLTTFLPIKLRRTARRSAKQLRKGQLVPKHPTIHDPEDLATILEHAAGRDEVVERAGQTLLRLGREIRRVAAEEGQAAINTFNTIFNDAAAGFTTYGPDSVPGRQYQRLMFFVSIGTEHEAEGRRGKKGSFADRIPGLRRDPSTQARWEATAAEILISLPAGETVFAFPAEESGSGRGRVLMRIGVGNASWIGSFERGDKGPSTVQAMPGNTRIFVSAAGAGYVIDVLSRTLVERTGNDVAGVIRDEPRTLFVVNHDGVMLEAFDAEGRLWKTGPLGAGGLRNFGLECDEICVEARQANDEWQWFIIDAKNGAVAAV